MKTDITMYSDDELSRVVFNTEYLYRLRHNPRNLLDCLEDEYIYTQAQQQILLNDLIDEDE